MARFVSFVVLVAILIGIGILFLEVMWAFLLPLFVAALLGVVFQPLYEWILKRVKNYRYVASAMTTALVLLVVLVPAGFVGTLAVLEGVSLFERLELEEVPDKIVALRKRFGLEMSEPDHLHAIDATIERWRQQQQAGDRPEIREARIDNLLNRVARLQAVLDDEDPNGTKSLLDGRPELDQLKQALEQLKTAEPESVEADTALETSDVSFRQFKREFLGGAYTAWLKELANPTDEQLKSLRTSLLGLANADQPQVRSLRNTSLVTLGGNTIARALKLLAGVIIMMIALFFFLAEGSRMIDGIVRLSPLEEKYLREMIAEFERVSRAVVAATLLSAVAQGLLAGIGFYFAGLSESVALLMIVTMLLAMVPFMGAAAVWIPVCLYLYFVKGDGLAAGLLAVYGTLVISTADNVIKPIVLHGQSNLHPLLALLSVLGGVATLGPIGIMIGPMAVVFLQTLLKILQREMLSLDRANKVPLAAWASGLTGKVPEGEEGPPMPAVDDEFEPPPPAGEVPSSKPKSPPPNGSGGSGNSGKKNKKRRK